MSTTTPHIDLGSCPTARHPLARDYSCAACQELMRVAQDTSDLLTGGGISISSRTAAPKPEAGPIVDAIDSIERWILNVRDSVLYRLAMEETDFAHSIHAEGLGQGSVAVLQQLYSVRSLARQLSAAQVPECPYPCGWGNLHTLAIRDGAYLARALQEDEPCPTNARATAMRMVDQLITVCRAALSAQPQEQSGNTRHCPECGDDCWLDRPAQPQAGMGEDLATRLESYIPRGDGYNSEFAHDLAAAAEALRRQGGPSADVEALRQDRDSWRRVAARLESEKQALASQLSAAQVCVGADIDTLLRMVRQYAWDFAQHTRHFTEETKATADASLAALFSQLAALSAQPQEQSAEVRYKVQSNYCNCHPETCCCDPWVVRASDGKVVATFYHHKDAVALVNTLQPAGADGGAV